MGTCLDAPCAGILQDAFGDLFVISKPKLKGHFLLSIEFMVRYYKTFELNEKEIILCYRVFQISYNFCGVCCSRNT